LTTHLVPSRNDGVMLGILAGGRATRLGGRDKAWLERDGTPLVLALAERLAAQVDATIVSANRNAERYLSHGLRAIHDRIVDIGPLGGLDALAGECHSEWLLTVPVDAVSVDDSLVGKLLAAGVHGAWAEDDDGPQPLIALWRTEALRSAVAAAVIDGDYAIHALQARLGMAPVRFDGLRFGNLNTPGDLDAAGIAL
jgi:molybdopterin-guanine dinucleotide biosynthesis protein A